MIQECSNKVDVAVDHSSLPYKAHAFHVDDWHSVVQEQINSRRMFCSKVRLSIMKK